MIKIGTRAVIPYFLEAGFTLRLHGESVHPSVNALAACLLGRTPPCPPGPRAFGVAAHTKVT